VRLVRSQPADPPVHRSGADVVRLVVKIAVVVVVATLLFILILALLGSSSNTH
jgi:hypothetical protein